MDAASTRAEADVKRRDDVARRLDLAFLRELRTASHARLRQIATNLGFGGPEWQRVAVDRALRRFGER